MNHPEADVLIRFADGEEVVPAIVAHIDGCDECRAALAELGGMEARVALASPIEPADRQAMRTVATRLLVRPAPRLVPRWRMVGIAVACAAALLALLSLWPEAKSGCMVELHRYDPPGDVRADRTERFRLSVDLAAGRWLSLWRLDAPERVTRLMPNADPLLRYLGAEMPLEAGLHRVPATDLFDFEFSTSAPPVALVLVPTADELSAAEITAVEALLASTARDQLPAAIVLLHPEAKVIPFPAH